MADVVDSMLNSFNLSSIRGQVYDIAYYVIWGLVGMAILAFVWFTYQDRKIFKYPVRVFYRRRNGLVKEKNTFGGYIQKGTNTVFVIKQGRFKKKELDRLPESEYMDEEDRLYFYQLSPEAPLVQCRRNFNIDKIFVRNEKFVEPTESQKEEIVNRYVSELKLVDENKDVKEEQLVLEARARLDAELDDQRNALVDITNVYYTPVPTDQKLQAVKDIQRLTQVLGVDVNKQFAYFIIGVIAMAIVGVVIFYIAVNKGDVPIITG